MFLSAMISKKSLLLAVGATGLFVAMTTFANAGNPAQCAVYANQAVMQQSQNLQNSCGFSGPRWGSNFGAHLAWCLSAPDSAINTERNARVNLLNNCVGGGGGGAVQARVCVYDGPNYSGAQICVNAGASDSSVAPAWNDRVTSLKVYGGAKIKLCQHVNYLGFCNTFSNNVPVLGTPLNNQASSYQTWE